MCNLKLSDTSILYIYHMASRVTYQNISPEVTRKPWRLMSPDAGSYARNERQNDNSICTGDNVSKYINREIDIMGCSLYWIFFFCIIGAWFPDCDFFYQIRKIYECHRTMSQHLCMWTVLCSSPAWKSQDRGPESYSSNAKTFYLRRRFLSHGLILISPNVYIVAQNLRYIK